MSVTPCTRQARDDSMLSSTDIKQGSSTLPHLRCNEEECNIGRVHGGDDAEVQALRPEVAQQERPQLGQRCQQVRFKSVHSLSGHSVTFPCTQPTA